MDFTLYNYARNRTLIALVWVWVPCDNQCNIKISMEDGFYSIHARNGTLIAMVRLPCDNH